MADVASTLLDHRGRPVRRAELQQELAAVVAGVRSMWYASAADDLTPARLASILRAAVNGDATAYLTLAEEMEERELHYGSVLGTRKLAVSGLDVAVEAASDEPGDVELANEVRGIVRRPEFHTLVDELLDGIAKGYSVCEIIWDRSASQWLPARYEWRDPRFFFFDRLSGRDLRLRDNAAPDGLALEPYKFVTHIPRLKSGQPIRGGLARRVAASYMCKSYSLRDWMTFAELFGIPLRIGKYGSGASAEDISTLVSAVVNLGSDAAAVLHDSMTIDLVERAGASGSGQLVFEALARWLDSQISKAVLGQTMTADDGSSLGQAKVHNDVRKDILVADARQLSATLNRDLVQPFIALNYGPQENYPLVALVIDEPEDLESLAKSLPPFIDRGLRVEASVIADKFGLPDPKQDAALLVPAAVGTQETAEGDDVTEITAAVRELLDRVSNLEKTRLDR